MSATKEGITNEASFRAKIYQARQKRKFNSHTVTRKAASYKSRCAIDQLVECCQNASNSKDTDSLLKPLGQV
jgi:hypothetical protein